jgi:hypothetical protein
MFLDITKMMKLSIKLDFPQREKEMVSYKIISTIRGNDISIILSDEHCKWPSMTSHISSTNNTRIWWIIFNSTFFKRNWRSLRFREFNYTIAHSSTITHLPRFANTLCFERISIDTSRCFWMAFNKQTWFYYEIHCKVSRHIQRQIKQCLRWEILWTGWSQ